MLRSIALLPLGVLYLFSDLLYPVVYHVVKYRRNVVRRNLTEAFPGKPAAEIRKLEKAYYRYLCDMIVETVKLLHISPAEMARRVRIEGAGKVSEGVSQGRSAVLLLGHYANWEWVQEIGGCFTDDAYKLSIYHPLKSRLWDEVFAAVRSRWHVDIVPQRMAAKRLLYKERQPWICGFIADGRPDPISDEAVIPFLNHYTHFIYGPEVIGRKVGADFFFLEMERERRGYYKITFHRLEPVTDGLSYPIMRAFWMEFERVIKKNPACWLWSHRRWKKDKLVEPV